MALLYCPRFQALDANGDPIAGARLHTFDSAATTTPKVTYADAAQTVPHANPVVADAAGVFPQVFGEEGAGYYCVLRGPDGVQIDEFIAVQMLGVDLFTEFLKDFALNGRFRVYGSAGIVNAEFMPIAGTEIGGAGRIGGANATQGSNLAVDFAQTTFSGTVEAQGFRRAGVVEWTPRLLLAGQVASLTTLDLALDAGFEAFELDIRHLSGTTGTLFGRLSFDGGATYKSAVNDYIRSGTFTSGAGTTPTTAAQSDALFLGIASAAPSTTAIRARINTKAGRETSVFTDCGQNPSAGNMTSVIAHHSTNQKNFGRATHIRLFSGSPASYDYRLMGVP